MPKNAQQNHHQRALPHRVQALPRDFQLLLRVLRKMHVLQNFVSRSYCAMSKKGRISVDFSVLDVIESLLVTMAGGGTMCGKCGKVLSHRYDARRHVRISHFSQDQYECEDCGKVLKHYWAYGDHMRKTHGKYVKKKY